MITGEAIYDVLSALVPLYAAMILAYGSVQWWKIFTPEQCSGINRFVAVFAVPLLTFHFISSNNPYKMNLILVAADSIQKAAILILLLLFQSFTKHGSLDWTITLFSISTLPNTLVIGIPLLGAMYGEFSSNLMVQIVVLQSLIWYTALLILFEYRGAKILISEQVAPEAARSVASFRVESDVASLGGREPLQADARVGEDGKVQLVIRRAVSYSDDSRLDGVEICSLRSSTKESTQSFNRMDIGAVLAQLRAVSSSRSSFKTERVYKSYPSPHFSLHRPSSADSTTSRAKDLHMYVWSSSSSSPAAEQNLRSAFRAAAVDSTSRGMHVLRGNDSQMREARHNSSKADLEYGNTSVAQRPQKMEPALVSQNETNNAGELEEADESHAMPRAAVMTSLILMMVWRKLIQNPNTYASIIGLMWSLIAFRWNVEMPKIVKGCIQILSNTGLGMAMFSLGLFMALQPKIMACGKRLAAILMVVRFLVGPIVMAAASLAVGIRGKLLQISLVQAALPQGIVPFVFAREYNCYPTLHSTGLVFGMLFALPVTIIYYILLGLEV